MRKVLYAIGVLIIVLIGSALVGPYLVPVNGLRQKIADDARKRTGHDITINGPIRWSVFPHLRLEAGDVTMENVPNGVAKNMATLSKLAIDLEVLPLLSGDVILDRLVLIDPVINLEIDQQGRSNWDFDEKDKPKPAKKKPSGQPAQARPAAADEDDSLEFDQLRLDDIRLENGAITYLDRRTNVTKSVQAINAKVKLPSLDTPLASEGSLVWNGKKLEMSLGVENPRALMAGTESAFSVRLTGDPVTAGFKGTAALSPSLKLTGDVDLQIPSVRDLAAWTGKPITPSGTTLGPLAVTGKLAMAGSVVSFSQATLQLDDIKAGGDISFDSSGIRPLLKGKLAIDRLDLGPYTRATTRAAPAPETAAPAAAPAPAAAAAPVRKSGDWNDAPINFAELKLADLDLALSMTSLQAEKIAIGKSIATIELKDGKLTALLQEMALYQGTGTGRIAIDSGDAVPTLQLDFKLDHVAARPFLDDAIGLDLVSGTAAFDVALTGQGKSERELISSLDGKGTIAVADGALQGINLPGLARNIGSPAPDAASGAGQKTDFAALSGTFTMTNGIIKNEDLNLKSSLIQAGGAGTVDLPQRQIDYRVTPTLVAGAGKPGGLTVPVLIRGPLDHPSYKPDLAGIQQEGGGNPLKQLKALLGGKK
jgi:AsmA protein